MIKVAVGYYLESNGIYQIISQSPSSILLLSDS